MKEKKNIIFFHLVIGGQAARQSVSFLLVVPESVQWMRGSRRRRISWWSRAGSFFGDNNNCVFLSD